MSTNDYLYLHLIQIIIDIKFVNILRFLTIMPPKDKRFNKMLNNCFGKAAVIPLGVREATGACPCLP